MARFSLEVALRTPGGAVTITWEAYAGQVRQIAAGLAGLGAGRGEAAQAVQLPTGLAEAYRRADEQVMSQIRLLLGQDQVRIAVSGGPDRVLRAAPRERQAPLIVNGAQTALSCLAATGS